MAKMGRPRKEIDKKQFEAMCAIQCTQEEICMILGVSDKTLNAWCRKTYRQTFSEVFREKRELGKMSLRRSMYENAVKKGNTTMQIWLSKQYLGMRETVQVDQTEILNKLDSVLDGIKEDADSQNADGE